MLKKGVALRAAMGINRPAVWWAQEVTEEEYMEEEVVEEEVEVVVEEVGQLQTTTAMIA